MSHDLALGRSDLSRKMRDDVTRSRTKRAAGVPRAATVFDKRTSKGELDMLRRLCPEANEPYWRPATRAECATVDRPCVFCGCAFNLYLTVSQKTGSIRLEFPHLEPFEMAHSCALDVADEGPQTLERVAEILGVTRERVRQIEVKAMARPELVTLAERWMAGRDER